MDTNPDEATQNAIETVARYIVGRAYSNPAASVHDIDWEDYPDIGERDWQRVVDRAVAITADLRGNREAYQAAYDLLGHRAE